MEYHYGVVFESVLSQVVCPGKKILPGHLSGQKLLAGTFAAANSLGAVTTGTFTEATPVNTCLGNSRGKLFAAAPVPGKCRGKGWAMGLVTGVRTSHDHITWY